MKTNNFKYDKFYEYQYCKYNLFTPSSTSNIKNQNLLK